MYRAALALVTLLPSLALADAPRLDPSWIPTMQLAQSDDDANPYGTASGRKFDMEVNFRGRYVFVPRSILDIWYYNEGDAGWADATRSAPRINGYALGLEFVIKNQNANGIFYVEWIESTLKEGYWDDKEEPPDHLDGEFLRPTPNLGMVTFGANYAYEAHFVRTAQTNGAFGLSFLVGGGLGVGIILGDLERWTPLGGRPGFVRYNDGDDFDDYKDIPKVLPMVDINAGLRFNFADRIMLRIEGGLHTMIYGGAALGVMF